MRSQARRTDPMHVLGAILFLVGAALVATGVIYVALVLLTAIAGYRDALP